MPMNPFYDQVKSLPDMYGSWNPMTYIQGQQQLDQANTFNQGTQRQQQQDISLADMMNPLKVQQQDLANQTTQARLPGILADSSLAQDKAKLSNQTLDQQIQEALAQHGAKVTKAHLDQLNSVGQIYSQAGQMMSDMPGMLISHDRAKQILGDKYMPELDNVAPKDLGATLKYMGDNMMKAGAQFQLADTKGQGALDVARERAQAMRDVEDKKAAAAKEIAQYKADLAERVAKAKQSQDPKTFQAAAAQLMKAANTEQDPDRKAELINQAQEFVNLQFAMAQASAQAQPKPDTAQLGVPTTPAAQAPQIGGGAPPTTDAAKYKQAFGSYEPDKYMYRIGPDGRPQRKLKGQ